MSVQKLRAGDVVAKTYEVENLVGAGPLGVTYGALVIDNQKKVSLKFLSGPAAEPRRLDEVVRKVQSVKSDGVVKTLRAGVWQDSTYVVAEWVAYPSLRELMDRYQQEKRAFTLQEAGQIISKVLDAVDSIHAAGLVHLHLKPSNIFVQSKYVGPGGARALHAPVVGGVGISAMVDPATAQLALADSQDGRYMAPDVGAPTHRADLYSVGVLLYELLCGQTPMGSYLTPSLIREDLPSKLDDVIDLALASNPEDRYPTARDMRNDIQRLFQEDEPGLATPVRSRRNLYLAITGGVILLATAASFLLFEDPVTAAKNADAKLRASVVKGNVLPSEAVVQEKVALRPDMVWIPEGSFIKGRMNSERASGPSEPLAEVKKVNAFYIDRFEWPNGQGKNTDVRVNWTDASSFCTSVGKRLCTSDEWERACKGPESLIFPYGDEFDAAKCGEDVAKDTDKDGKSDHRSGSLAECKSGFGVFDLSGGPREWTATGRGQVKTIKGGRRGLKPEVATRCAWSDEQKPAIDDATLSFRCCSDDVAPGEATPPAEGAAPGAPAAPAGDAPKPG